MIFLPWPFLAGPCIFRCWWPGKGLLSHTLVMAADTILRGTIVKFRDLSLLTPSNCPSWGALGSLRGISYQRVETELHFLTWVVGIRTLPAQWPGTQERIYFSFTSSLVTNVSLLLSKWWCLKSNRKDRCHSLDKRLLKGNSNFISQEPWSAWSKCTAQNS